eukprot:c14553_g1_i1.p1 GENE.c14553_g1_i1~~c14553_g1_i1.p1  ORF type:complete len:684 (+),score=149.77 c14553_g1_i1:197-2053(+)
MGLSRSRPHNQERRYGAPSIVRVDPSVLESSDWVNVSWSDLPIEFITQGGGEYICTQDSFCSDVLTLHAWIGVFVHGADVSTIGPQDWPTSNPPWLATAPIKWKPINSTSGMTRFYMEAMRDDLDIHLFRNGTSFPILVASATLAFTNLNRPHNVHIMRSYKPEDMRVIWQSSQWDAAMRVSWGTKSRLYNHNVSAVPSTYTVDDLCGPPATTHGWHNPGVIYDAILGGLPAGQQIFYRVGSDKFGFSPEFSFVAPVPASPNASLTIYAIADLGETYIDGAQYHWMEPYAINTTNHAIVKWSSPDTPQGLIRMSANPMRQHSNHSGRTQPPAGTSLKQLAAKMKPTKSRAQSGRVIADLLLHVGDISYATGYLTEWDRFFAQIEPIATQVPYMTGLGNHERDWPNTGVHFNGMDSGGECGTPTEFLFRMPTPSRKQDQAWYSFDQGNVHFVMMNTEIGFAAGSEQLLFLDTDLKGVNRQITPWVVFMGHRPMYYSNKIDAYFQGLEPLLVKYHVDLCLWGHTHFAQRTCAVVDGACVTTKQKDGYDGPVHAIIGNAGQSLESFPPPEQRAPWSLFEAAVFGYSVITTTGPTKLEMQFFRDIDNVLLHNFTLERSWPRI